MFRILALLILIASPTTAQEFPFASFDLASEPVLNDPHDLTIGPDGHLYIADKFGSRIVVMDAETLEIIDVIADGLLPGVHDIAFDAAGNAVIAVTGLSRVITLDISGDEPQVLSALSAVGTEGALPHSNGRIYAMASYTGQLIAYENGQIVAVVDGLSGAHDLAEDLEGNIWVANTGAANLVKFDADLNRLDVLRGPEFNFAGPRYLDVDQAGRLVVADQDGHRILMIDPNAPIGQRLLGVLGDGKPGIGPNKFDDPEGVSVSGSRYFFSDSDNNRIVRYSIVMN